MIRRKHIAQFTGVACLLGLAAVLIGKPPVGNPPIGDRLPFSPPLGDEIPDLTVDCDWPPSMPASVFDPANMNYCTPPPMDKDGIPLAHLHPITGEVVGYVPPGQRPPTR